MDKALCQTLRIQQRAKVKMTHPNGAWILLEETVINQIIMHIHV